MANKRTARPPGDSLADVMLRLLLDKTPLPPRLVHERHIQTYRERAYYRVLNEDGAFRRALADLLDHWTYSAAAQFARRWHVPERGLTDLTRTHSLWRSGYIRKPRLEIRSRSYPGPEDEQNRDEMRRLGYRRHPPRLKDEGSLRLGALRLYRRAVLGWPWQTIAGAEDEEEPRENFDTKSVRDDVNRWAKALGVPLPQVPRGRPPASPKSAV